MDEIAAISDVARYHKLSLHMDGARIANAIVSLGVTPAEATWKSGVDVLSLGATKNGAFAAEAVIFDPEKSADFEFEEKEVVIFSQNIDFYLRNFCLTWKKTSG